MLKQFERCTGRGCDTPRLHQKEMEMIDMPGIILGDSDDEEPYSPTGYKVDA